MESYEYQYYCDGVKNLPPEIKCLRSKVIQIGCMTQLFNGMGIEWRHSGDILSLFDDGKLVARLRDKENQGRFDFTNKETINNIYTAMLGGDGS
jgi:hypothetical protein